MTTESVAVVTKVRFCDHWQGGRPQGRKTRLRVFVGCPGAQSGVYTYLLGWVCAWSTNYNLCGGLSMGHILAIDRIFRVAKN